MRYSLPFPTDHLKSRFLQLFVGLLVVAFSILPGKADEPEKKEVESAADEYKFMRVETNDQDEVLALQTAITRYELDRPGKSPVRVDLIGVIHIGDKEYYESLERQFKFYDALLYELVAPPEALRNGFKPDAREGGNIVSSMQLMMKDVLQLEFQLENIDYMQKNFVHADMSPDQLFKTMKDKGETPINLFLRIVQANAAMQAQPQSKAAEMALMMTAFDAPDVRARKLKAVFAKEFIANDTFLSSFSGEQGFSLITDRNDVALEVMQREIDKGSEKIGIFYGAGHMEDMHQKLIDKYNMKPVKTVWLNAWTVQQDKVPQEKETATEKTP
ncbi:hypothetical protein Pla110_16840 [Polystyrenella longa]|uniref:TraB family protein n=1 Tax=Polystyrenella longa TaxID=2528007 RepID=A0A518CL55_9PLAN|nr:hypothetical protein [Polystyrenella longa]QDU79962.1 hypothetical protein Pla110_16840 [Polystyrenella longa]